MTPVDLFADVLTSVGALFFGAAGALAFSIILRRWRHRDRPRFTIPADDDLPD